MASAHRKGEERIDYVAPGGAPVTHLLAVPLRLVGVFRPGFRRTRHEFWAEDNIHRSVVTVGPGVREMRFTVRMDDDPAALELMLRHALEWDLTLEYRRTAAGVVYPFRVVDVDGAEDGALIHPDRDTHYWGEWEASFLARRTDGGTFDGLLLP